MPIEQLQLPFAQFIHLALPNWCVAQRSERFAKAKRHAGSSPVAPLFLDFNITRTTNKMTNQNRNLFSIARNILFELRIKALLLGSKALISRKGWGLCIDARKINEKSYQAILETMIGAEWVEGMIIPATGEPAILEVWYPDWDTAPLLTEKPVVRRANKGISRTKLCAVRRTLST